MVLFNDINDEKIIVVNKTVFFSYEFGDCL